MSIHKIIIMNTLISQFTGRFVCLTRFTVFPLNCSAAIPFPTPGWLRKNRMIKKTLV